ncbi:translation protein [Thamnocephalis sphaerospora]|uniref:Large ribosomal subunit protein uL3m n=1 Tax=Thamnocephalis sphaerospora TaxID=78915 RepID=A0A4P9XUY4_9FUNG|nr:translation protein [Thamnocephalis sphaerospora]|eukprot:RKP10067.1 translation protein [Thamnocephalis sphaerospora]
MSGFLAGRAPITTTAQSQPAAVKEPEATAHAPWTPESRRTGVIALKIGMTALWDEWGVRHPVTVLKLDNVQVIQARPSAEQEGMVKLQLGAVNQLPQRVTKPERGHFAKAGVQPKKYVCEFLVTKDAALPVTTEITAAHFLPGQFVDVTAPTIGKGFAGGMKRHGFKGLRASHGVSLTHRSLGSTGQCQDPGKVFKGKKMAGRMGGKNATMQNLKVMKVDAGLNLLYVRGAVPGHKTQYIRVKDAVKMRGAKPFPADALPPPFPTYLSETDGALPRERIARMSVADPFMPKAN